MRHNENILLVEVPQDVLEFYIEDNNVIWEIEERKFSSANIPPGQWEIIGRADQLGEEQCYEIVESDQYWDGAPEDHGLGAVRYYRDYPEELRDSCLFTATESLASLVASHGMKLETTLVLKLKS